MATMYSTPRIGTCQALLLLCYREVGIGAMAQAWIYMRMAVAMALDLGMQKTAEKWRRTGVNMFTRAALEERRRVWHGCIVMDKYISSYIGRPVAISARDFDTEQPGQGAVSCFVSCFSLPPLDGSLSIDGRERNSGVPGLSKRPAGDDGDHSKPCHLVFQCCLHPLYVLTPSQRPFCLSSGFHFTACILSSIVQCIYSIRPEPDRTSQFHTLEEILESWFLELPEHLRYDPTAAKFSGTSGRLPPPNVLTLHMNYWCTVILLHRPFIRHLSSAKG